MKTRTWLGLVALLALLSAGVRAADKAPPNFIIIYTDDQGWADTSVPMMDGEPMSKSDSFHTPHLERLAARARVGQHEAIGRDVQRRGLGGRIVRRGLGLGGRGPLLLAAHGHQPPAANDGPPHSVRRPRGASGTACLAVFASCSPHVEVEV